MNWTQTDLAEEARVSVVTIRNFELGKTLPQRASLEVMQRALEEAGVEFLDGDRPGVRLGVAATTMRKVLSDKAAVPPKARRPRKKDGIGVAVTAPVRSAGIACS